MRGFVLGRANHLDDAALRMCERIPYPQIKPRALARGRRVESGPVAVFGNGVKSEIKIAPRTDPLGGINGTFLEGIENLVAGKLYDVRTEPGESHVQTLEIFNASNLAIEPTAPLRSRVGAQMGLDIVLLGELVPKFLPASVEDPCVELGDGHAEGNRVEEGEGFGPVAPIPLGGMVHVYLAVRDGVEDLERRHKFPGRIDFDVQRAFGRFGDFLGKRLGGCSQPWKSPGPAGCHA